MQRAKLTRIGDGSPCRRRRQRSVVGRRDPTRQTHRPRSRRRDRPASRQRLASGSRRHRRADGATLCGCRFQRQRVDPLRCQHRHVCAIVCHHAQRYALAGPRLPPPMADPNLVNVPDTRGALATNASVTIGFPMIEEVRPDGSVAWVVYLTNGTRAPSPHLLFASARRQRRRSRVNIPPPPPCLTLAVRRCVRQADGAHQRVPL